MGSETLGDSDQEYIHFMGSETLLQEYIYFMGSETLPEHIYFMGSETLPSAPSTLLLYE